MNAKWLYILLPVVLLSLSACSESEKVIETPPPVVEKISFPYINDHTLYSFEPVTGDRELIVQSNRKMMLSLDIDQTTSITIDEENFLQHSRLPEYIIYVTDQALHLYDPATRHDHELISFTPAQGDTSSAAEYICDIQKIITIDKESAAQQETLLKDETGVYVKTSLNENCSEDEGAEDEGAEDAPPSFNYYQLSIETSTTETFEIRQSSLLKHTHVSTHEHDHDNDSHSHEHSDKEIEDKDFDTNNHAHNHTHTHEKTFKDLVQHHHLTQEEVDETHNDTNNQEIEFRTFPVFVAKKLKIDQALMYSGTPIVDIENKQFGYLGFNTKEQAYKFYATDPENLKKTELWTMPVPGSLIPLRIPTDKDQLFPHRNKPQVYQELPNGILLTHSAKLVKLVLEDLFDDDQDKEREFSFAHPLFETSDQKTASYHYNSETDEIAVKYENSIFIIKNHSNEPYKLVRTFSNDALDKFSIAPFSDEVIVLKDLSFNETPSVCPTQDICSFTSVNIESGQENTLISKSTDGHRLRVFGNVILANLEDSENNTWNAQFFKTDLRTLFSPPLVNSIWGVLKDLRYDTENESTPTIVNANSGTSSEANEKPTLSAPNLYTFDIDATLGQGELIGTIPTEVAYVKEIVVFNEYYGLIELKESSAPDAPTKTYFFPPEISNINVTGEFGDMKLLFEETIEPAISTEPAPSTEQ